MDGISGFGGGRSSPGPGTRRPHTQIGPALATLAACLLGGRAASADYLVPLPGAPAHAGDYAIDGLAPGYVAPPFLVRAGTGQVAVGKSLLGLAAGVTTVDGVGFDTLSGAPLAGLFLATGGATTNLDILAGPGGAVLRAGGVGNPVAGPFLAGVGPAGYPNAAGIGEGSLAVQLPAGEAAFGFAVLGGDGGDAVVTAYRLDGSVVGSLTITNLRDIAYGFATSDGTADVAAFTLTNTDPGGIGIDHIKVAGGQGVPEPAGVVLMAVGLAGMVCGRAWTLRRPGDSMHQRK